MSTVRAIRSAWGFREYILASVKRDFASKYLGTQLGWFWAVAQPLALIAIYTLVFAQVMKPARRMMRTRQRRRNGIMLSVERIDCCGSMSLTPPRQRIVATTPPWSP